MSEATQTPLGTPTTLERPPPAEPQRGGQGLHITFPPPQLGSCSAVGAVGTPARCWSPQRTPGLLRTSLARGLLTQQGRGAITQGVLLVAGHAERWDGVEGLGQEGLQARGAGVGSVEEVVDLLAGGTQLSHWGREGGVRAAQPAWRGGQWGQGRGMRAGGHGAE